MRSRFRPIPPSGERLNRGSDAILLAKAAAALGLATHEQTRCSMPQPGRLVLCVDDEKIGLLVRRTLLERAGYRVLTAPDGPSGLAVFQDHPVEAVVLDFAMPGMNGDEVAGHMRRTKPEVPILLLSAYVGLAPEVLESVSLYMTKGEGAPALLEKLASLLPGAEGSHSVHGQGS